MFLLNISIFSNSIVPQWMCIHYIYIYTYTVAQRWHVYLFIYLVRTIIQSLLNIKGRSFIREEFCPAPESNMPLNNAKDTIVHCHFITIGPKAGLSSTPISFLVFTLANITSDFANLPSGVRCKSMVIFYGETWSILHTAWLNCSKVEQATVSRGRLFQWNTALGKNVNL